MIPVSGSSQKNSPSASPAVPPVVPVPLAAAAAAAAGPPELEWDARRAACIACRDHAIKQLVMRSRAMKASTKQQ
eukprot:scaffold63454_cov20-Tisochrysis_lutea.AAC.1